MLNSFLLKNKFIKTIILVISFLGILSFNLTAQTKREKIKTLFSLMKTDSLIHSMLDNITGMSFKNSPNQDTQKDSIYKAYVKEETIAFSKKMYEEDMVGLYDKYFTIAEIQKYIDFYKTPEGRKMLEVMPAMMKDFMSNMMTKEMPELQAKFKQKLEELQH